MLERLEIETLEKDFCLNKIYENIRDIQVQKQTYGKYDGFFSCASGRHNIIPKISIHFQSGLCN